MMLSDLPPFPGLTAYRDTFRGKKVHLAVKWNTRSLCGRRMPQMTWRPEDDAMICKTCANSYRVMGLGEIWP